MDLEKQLEAIEKITDELADYRNSPDFLVINSSERVLTNRQFHVMQDLTEVIHDRIKLKQQMEQSQ